MTHIEQMIQDLCPQGVEFKKLGEVTYWDKRFNEVERSMQPQIRKYHYYLASELEDLESPTGTIKILYTSNKIAYAEEETVAENVVDAEVVAIPWGGNANIKYFKGKFVTADNRIAVVRDTSILSTKFVYYWLKQNQEEIDSYYRGAGIKHPSMLKVLSFEIPIPPMEVQKHIVTVLDAYSALAAELQAELQMRRKQYEYYRTQLLTPHSDCNSADKTDDCNWGWRTLGEVCKFQNGFAFQSSKFMPSGKPILRITNIKDSQIDDSSLVYFNEEDYHVNLDPYKILPNRIVIAMSGATTGKIGMNRSEQIFYMNQRVGMFIPDESLIDNNYLFHYLSSQTETLYYLAGGGAQPNLSTKAINELPIPLPSLSEQKRIAELLNKLSILTTSLSDGIPAEQALQQKRYEYYRDKLLTFEKRP